MLKKEVVSPSLRATNDVDMAFQPAKDAEPIPGYRFLEKLGTGGYGEVWKVTAPGGLMKAIKVVYGDLGGARAGQELKALERIKQVRHPFLLSLERFEIIDGQLFIVTELADGCLMDRFQECREQGLKGIPRDELLGYLRDAADALDYMAETHGLQHLDIKPQNLLLLSGRVKVADFGLVKELVGTSVTATGGVTPIYATPEAFDGRVSRYSDQYSLAIVYQEMLTGVRPFPGITMMQLAAQHTSSPPMLQPLPAGDRPAIARALSKTPDQRFPSCQKLAEALITGRLTSTTNPIITPEVIARSKKTGQLPRVKVPPPPTVASPEPLASPGARELANAAVRQHRGPEILSPPPDAATRLATPPYDTSSTDIKPGLRPTLFVGVGGLACATLRHLRRRLHQHYGSLTRVPIFRLLQIDTDREEIRAARQGEGAEALDASETLLTSLHLPEYYRADAKKLLRWLDRRWLYGIPRSLLTEGLRPLGRLALIDNVSNLLSQLREVLDQIRRAETIDATLTATGLSLRDTTPRIFLVASIAGGTGGGMLLSLAYAIRQVLAELGISPHGLCGLLLHATSPKPADQLMARINATATLTELHHFSQPHAAYPGDADVGLQRFSQGEPPFEDCYLVHLGEGLAQAGAAEATRRLAEYLFLDTTPEGGATLDRFRLESRASSNAEGLLRAFGLSRIGSGGAGSALQEAHRCCRRLTELWAGLTTTTKQDQDRSVALEAQREVLAQGLDAAVLVDGLCGTMIKQLGESPESYFTKLGFPVAGGAVSVKMVQLALEKLEQFLGVGRDSTQSQTKSQTPLTAAIHQKASNQAVQIATGLLDWLLDLIETPGKRMQAAESGAAWIVKHLRELMDKLRAERTLAKTQATALCELLLTGKPGGKGSGIRWLGRSRPVEATPSSPRQLVEYGNLRLREMALFHAQELVRAVQERFTRFLPDLAVCGQKLKQFAAQFRSPPQGTEPVSRSKADAPDATPLPADLLLQFDTSIQEQVLEPHGGLWSLFTNGQALRRSRPCKSGPANPTGFVPLAEAVLKEELLSRAQTFLREAMPERNAARLFLEEHGSAEEARPVLLQHLEEARPRLRVEGQQEQLLLGVPEGPAKSAVLKCVVDALPDLPILAVKSEEDLFLVYEGAGYPLLEMATALIGPTTPDPELVQRVMTRQDVAWSSWTPVPAET